MFRSTLRRTRQETLSGQILVLILAFLTPILLIERVTESTIMTRRTWFLLLAFVLAAGSTAVADPLGNGTKEEREACAPEAVKFCKHELDANSSDTKSILKCLQRNRQKISGQCQGVLANHGQ
jgi:hypothetical protein